MFGHSVETGTLGILLDGAQGSDQITVNRSLLPLLVLPESLPKKLADSPVFLLRQAFNLFELRWRQGDGNGSTGSHMVRAC